MEKNAYHEKLKNKNDKTRTVSGILTVTFDFMCNKERVVQISEVKFVAFPLHSIHQFVRSVKKYPTLIFPMEIIKHLRCSLVGLGLGIGDLHAPALILFMSSHQSLVVSL